MCPCEDCWLCFQKEVGGHVEQDDRGGDDTSYRDGDRRKVRKSSHCWYIVEGWNLEQIEKVVHAS